MKEAFVVHPFLFAVFPILSLYSSNVQTLLIFETFLPTAIVLSLTILSMLLLSLTLKDRQKAGVIVSCVLVAFFSFGPIFNLIRNWQIGGFIPAKHEVYIVLTIFTILVAYYVYHFTRTRNNLSAITHILNAVAIFLCLSPLINIGIYKASPRPSREQIEKRPVIELATTHSVEPNGLPDIYYIILDRYGDARTLKEIYSFDNREFVDYLSRRGFYVATDSKSNYLKTAHSLASSLNLNYLNHPSDKATKLSTDWSPLYAMLKDHKVWHFLKSKGYQFIHVGSWWGPARSNKHADVNISFDPLPQFFYVLYRQTMLYPIGFKLGVFDFRLAQWKRELYNFDKLAQILRTKGPNFIFAHVLITHEPYVFDQNGNFLTSENIEQKTSKEHYVNQIIFANRKLRELVNKILSTSEVQPIIILQADEGPWPQRYLLDEWNFDWRKATDTELRQKMGILNAYYLPGVDKGLLYPSITPVNSFRAVFNLYFGTNLELLPDKNYAFVDQRHPYHLFDVTDKVR